MINSFSGSKVVVPIFLFIVLLLSPYIPGLGHLALSFYVLLSHNYSNLAGSRLYHLFAQFTQLDRSGYLSSFVHNWNLQFPAMLIGLLLSGSGSILGFAAYRHVYSMPLSRIDMMILLILAIILLINLLRSLYNFEDIQTFYIYLNPEIFNLHISPYGLTIADFRKGANLTLTQQYMISIIKLFSLSSIEIYALGKLGFLMANDAQFTMWQAIQSALSLGPFNFEFEMFSGANWSYYKLVFQFLLLIWLAIYVALSDMLKPVSSADKRE